jgi:cytidylate kinase
MKAETGNGAKRPLPGESAATPRDDHSRVIAIDGPAAAGKSTVAQALADRLGAMLFDTGTLYRAVTLAALRHDVPFDDGPALALLAGERHIDVAPPSAPDGRLYDVRLDGEDVTWPIRAPDVETGVSLVASHPEVRAALLPAQRRIAAGGPVVMVGRDIGTVVVPDAGVKVYLEASLAERARRRRDELGQRGAATDLAAVIADLKRRDDIDSGRASSPLRVARDAVVVNTDGAGIDQVVDRIERLVRPRWETAPATASPYRDRA